LGGEVESELERLVSRVRAIACDQDLLHSASSCVWCCNRRRSSRRRHPVGRRSAARRTTDSLPPVAALAAGPLSQRPHRRLPRVSLEIRTLPKPVGGEGPMSGSRAAGILQLHASKEAPHG